MNLNLRSVCAIALAGFAMWVNQASAQSYQYTYTGSFLTPDGQVGNPYTTADRISLSFISDVPMPTGAGDHAFGFGNQGWLSATPDGHSISSFAISDGLHTITQQSVPDQPGHGPELYVTLALGSQGSISGYTIDTAFWFPVGEGVYNRVEMRSLGTAISPNGGGSYRDTASVVNNIVQMQYEARTTSAGQWTVTAVPEPETYAMLLAGLGLIGAVARRRKLVAR